MWISSTKSAPWRHRSAVSRARVSWPNFQFNLKHGARMHPVLGPLTLAQYALAHSIPPKLQLQQWSRLPLHTPSEDLLSTPQSSNMKIAQHRPHNRYKPSARLLMVLRSIQVRLEPKIPAKRPRTPSPEPSPRKRGPDKLINMPAGRLVRPRVGP